MRPGALKWFTIRDEDMRVSAESAKLLGIELRGEISILNECVQLIEVGK
jgi:hypothetical protein